MKNKTTAILLAALFSPLSSAFAEVDLAAREGKLEPFLKAPAMDMAQVFEKGRFPNIVVALDGTLLATWADNGIIVRRSEDGGETWGEKITASKYRFHGGGVTVDETTGDILLFAEEDHPPAHGVIYRSKDHGKTWRSEEARISNDSKDNMASFHMNDHGITLRHGKHAGRLVRATRFYGKKNHRDEWPTHYTNAIYSDDGGKTWKTSEPFPENGTGEACIVELSDGTLYYNSRVHWHERPKNTRRRSAISKDGGKTWEDWKIVEILPDGIQQRSYGCMGGLTRLAVKGRDVLLFSNIDTPNPKRENATVWASFDGGKTWPIKRLVYEGPSAYSSMISGRAGSPTEGWIYLQFEGGAEGGSTVARFNLSWVLGGEATGDGEVPDWAKKKS